MTLAKIKSKSEKLEEYSKITSSPNAVSLLQGRMQSHNTNFSIPSLFKISNIKRNSHL